MSESPWPERLCFQKRLKILKVTFDDGQSFNIPYALLRKRSPSADKGQKKQQNFETPDAQDDIDVLSAEPVGRYAVTVIFSDGHSTGIYSWGHLYELGEYAKATVYGLSDKR